MDNVLSMGVMNITPNSFSDGGSYLKENFLQSFHSFEIIDVGAESTAPMNEAISEDLEKERLEFFFRNTESFQNKVISLDSYKPDVVFWFFESLEKCGFKTSQFIWNDVSGQWDDPVEKFLRDYKESRFIFCHSLVPSREESTRHMHYLMEEELSSFEIVTKVQDHFKVVKEDLMGRVVFDPCFGFSKNAHQSFELMKNWKNLVQIHEHWLFGISKKSFLRSWWQENIQNGSKEFLLEKSEYLHLLWLQRVIGESHGLKSLVLRVHDHSLISLLKSFSVI